MLLLLQEEEDFTFMRYDTEGRTDLQSIVELFKDSGVQALLGGVAHHVMLITG